MTDDFFDFGFTAVNEEEVETNQVKERQSALERENERLATELGESHERLAKMYRAVQPLLENLKANPEKDYIYWPGRKEKVDSFSKHLSNIFQGNGE